MLPQSAYIKLVEGSTHESITLEDVKNKFDRYIEQTGLTGKQLNWDYAGAAFPYEIEHPPEGEGKWFYLKGKDRRMYNYLIVGVGSEAENSNGSNDATNEQHYIQIVLPDDAHHGDKSKGNEFCKYLAKQFQAELHMFNGRVMYFNSQK